MWRRGGKKRISSAFSPFSVGLGQLMDAAAAHDNFSSQSTHYELLHSASRALFALFQCVAALKKQVVLCALFLARRDQEEKRLRCQKSVICAGNKFTQTLPLRKRSIVSVQFQSQQEHVNVFYAECYCSDLFRRVFRETFTFAPQVQSVKIANDKSFLKPS